MPKINSKPITFEESINQGFKNLTDEDFRGAKVIRKLTPSEVAYYKRYGKFKDEVNVEPKSKNLVEPKKDFLDPFTPDEIKILGEWRKKHKKIRDEIDDIFDELANIKLPPSTRKEIVNIHSEYKNGHDVGNVDFDSVKSRLIAILKPKAKSTTKSDLKHEIQEVLKMVESIKIPKKTKSKNLSKAIEITELIAKTPMTKKINSTKVNKEIQESIDLIDKLIKADKTHLKYHPSKEDAKELKEDMKLMKQAKGYKHKVKDVSPLVENYVSQFKSVLQANQVKGGVMTRTLNDLRKAFYNKAKPSEVDDANALIIQYRSTLPSKAKVVKAKVPKAPSEDADYQKLLKTKIAYIKKNKPSITDPEDIKILADEMIGKKVRSSKKCLEECLNDLGMSGSGIRRKRIKGGIVGGDDDEEEEEEDVEPDDLTYEQEMEDASDAFMSVVSPMDTEDMGTGNLNIFLNSLSIDPTNPNDRMIGDLYTRVVIPKFRSGFVVEDSASVLYALVNLTRSQRNEAVKMLANALKERKGLTGHLKDLKKHRDREDDDGEGGGKRHAHHLVRGHGMKFKQALQQAGNEKRLF